MTQVRNRTTPLKLAREWLNDERPKGDITGDKVTAAIQLMMLDTLGDICECMCNISRDLEMIRERYEQQPGPSALTKRVGAAPEPCRSVDVPPIGGETVVCSPPPPSGPSIDC